MVSFRIVARPLLAAPFIVEGVDTAMRPQRHVELLREDRAGLMAATRPLLERTGVPVQVLDDPTPIVRLSGAVTAVAGLALATGRNPRLSAFILAGVAAKTALVRYPVWRAEDAEERKELAGALLTRAGLVGGALIAAADREGRPSLAWRASHGRAHRARVREIKARAREAKARAKDKVR